MKKKLLSLVLVAAMALAAVACGSKEEAPAATEEKAVLVMATNAEFPPYEYYQGDKVVGIDAEIAGLIAEKLGMELQIVDIAFDSIIPGVQSGKYDMGMAGLTVTDERLESFANWLSKIEV